MENITLIATSSFGLEAVVAREVRELGYDDVHVENGRIIFNAGLEAICRANLRLRTADRVRLVVGEFEAKTFDELFEKTKALPWAELIPRDANFPVEGKSVKSTLFSVPDCQAIVKKAVVESMKKQYKCDWFEETGPMHKIEVALLKDRATLTIDTSGPGLHKRGYRTSGAIAPLKETLAAGMIMLAKWNADIPLIDPFCGSGTIPIEAALMGKNIAPGLNRNFVSEDWPLIRKKLWRDARKECWDVANYDLPVSIMGTDMDYRSIKMARENASEAGIDTDIHFQQQPLSSLSTKKKYGKIICNPPYGERLPTETERLYREMGDIFRGLDTWSCYILTSNTDFEKIFGAPATKKRKLYNGNIRVDYYQYYGPAPPRKHP